MTTEILDKNEIVTATNNVVSELIELISSLDENDINTIPYEGSWTAAQLLRHISKSMKGMAKTLQMDAKPADRDPGQRVEELKKIFLDSSNKFESPDFIVPEEEVYKKQYSIAELRNAFKEFEENINNISLNELIESAVLGPITKWEIIHFVLYHTQRHLLQMQKICAALKVK